MSSSCQVCDKPNSTKKCTACKAAVYCSVDCQKKDWPEHKQSCGLCYATYFAENKGALKYEDFEVIKKLGDGNFTEVFKVSYKLFPSKYFALKVCSLSKVKSLRKETDILLEKHSLNKL